MDLLALRATLGLDSTEYENGLENARSNAVSIGKAMAGGLKVGIAALGAATTAVGVLVKQSVDAYAEYQQLEGGVKKLYGNMGLSLEDYAKSVGKSVDEVKVEWKNLEKAQDLVLENARNAYKTSGMSMNQYMETATSFSAALINSLGGDTIKAAEQTEVAMRAISDNFNTFGGDIGSIQYAFQGFAKQNYTMLDNLKLGYGGTKTEMERLIDDANEYAKSIGLASDLSIDSFSDVVTAIDLIQQKQKIAGTTSREASSTISGSMGSMKAAWENLLTGMSDPNADIGKLIDNMVETATVSIGNMVPTIERALGGVATLIQNIAPVISEELPSLISQILPSLISAGATLIAGIVASLPEIISSLIEAIPSIFQEVVSSISENIPSLIEEMQTIGSELFNGFLNGLNNELPNIASFAQEVIPSLVDYIINGADAITAGAAEIINSLANGLSKALPKLIPVAMNAIMEFSGGLRKNIGSIVDAGLNLIMTLANALISNIPVFIQTIPTIVSNIAGIINDNAPKLLAAGVELIMNLVQGIIDSWPVLVEEFPKIIQAILDVWQAVNWLQIGSNIITFIVNGVKSLVSALPTALKSIGEAGINIIKGINWAAAGKAIIQFILNGVKALVSSIPNALAVMAKSGMSKVTSVNWSSVGRTVINKIKSGISALASSIPKKLKETADSAKKKFTSIDWNDVGGKIVSGIASGISNGASSIISAAKDAARNALKAAKDFLGIKSPSRVFRDQVGKMISLGLAEGIEDSSNEVEGAVEGLASMTTDPFDSFTSVEKTGATEVVGGDTYIFNLYGVNDPEDFANRAVRQFKLQARTV